MAEQMCRVSSEIELCWEGFGDCGNPPLLLVMGLATQMIAWPEELCGELADRGFYVVRFDNRDAGRSTHVRGRPPTVGQIMRRSRKPARYTLADMAGDTVGLLRELDLGPAHVVGASMGGMIAQTVAARHPQWTRSLVSIMSTTGGRWVGQPSPLLYPLFLRRPGEGREAAVSRTVKVFKAIGSRGLPNDLELIREVAERSYDRDHDPSGPGRQLAAILASGNRTGELRRITAPTTVIHGTDDRMVAPSGGRATARAIPDARVVVIDGMGHDLPRAAWPRIVDAIVSNAARATEAPTASGTAA
ncbi:MAG: alpha/beta hydrolase [Actinobacteria bacterium]|nr:alpha/beta hydrolase [Actinomycetota bacterium]